MNKVASFRQLVSAPGTFLNIGSPVITEIAAQFPFSWLLLDMEHGGFSTETITEHLRILAPTPLVSIVRVPSANASVIGRLLDEGADGIMVPHVVSAADVEEIKRAMYYLPDGKRGFSSSVRQFSYGNQVPDDVGKIEKPLLFAQIEDVQGVLNANEIAGVNGVDVMFIGPADLKQSIKHEGIHGIDYEMSLRTVAKAAALYKKKAGILIRDKKLYVNMQEYGFSVIGINSDIALLRKGFEEALN